MNKSDLVAHIAEQHNCTKIEAEKVIDTFTSSVISAVAVGQEISLIGFGSFNIQETAAREGKNPRTGEVMNIPASKQVRFKAGQKLKDAVNNK